MAAYARCALGTFLLTSVDHVSCCPQDAKAPSKRQQRAAHEALQRQLYQQLNALRMRLLAQIDDLQLPTNPLDTLIDELGGPDAVAEMTGARGLGQTMVKPR